MTRPDPPLARPAPARGLDPTRGACSPGVRRRPRRAQPLAWIAALAGALAATSVRAESPSPVRLEWIRGESAETCPSGAWAAAEVRRRLGHDPFSMNGERSIEVTLQRTRSGWKGEVRDRPSSGAAAASRAFTSADPSCAPLAEALALAITLTLDPELARARAATPASPASPPAPAPATPSPSAPTSAPLPNDTGAPQRPSTTESTPAASAPPPPSPAPPPPSPLSPSAPPSASPPRPPHSSTSSRQSAPARPELPRLSTSLAAGALVGLLPHTALALQLSARARIAGFLSIESAALFLADNTTPDGNLTFGLTAGRLGACADLASGARGAVMICPDLLLGALHAIVRDQSLAASGVSPWGAAAVDLEGDLAVIGRLYLGVRGGFIVPIVPYRLYSSEHNFPLFRQRALTLEGLLSVGVHFP